jgi:hypothetical protein
LVVAGPAIRLPTLRTVGIVGAFAGYAALAWPLARWLWPTPVGTIDFPAPASGVDGCTVARGRVEPGTVRGPVWLIEDHPRGWQPVDKIDPVRGRWQARICLDGFRGEENGFALIVADEALDERQAQELTRMRSNSDDEIPEWLTRHAPEEQGGRGRRHRDGSVPAGAKLLALTEVVRLDGLAPPYLPMGPLGDLDRWRDGSVADERKRRRRHHERRGGGAGGFLQRPVVGGVAGAVDGVGGGRP